MMLRVISAILVMLAMWGKPKIVSLYQYNRRFLNNCRSWGGNYRSPSFVHITAFFVDMLAHSYVRYYLS